MTRADRILVAAAVVLVAERATGPWSGDAAASAAGPFATVEAEHRERVVAWEAEVRAWEAAGRQGAKPFPPTLAGLVSGESVAGVASALERVLAVRDGDVRVRRRAQEVLAGAVAAYFADRLAAAEVT